MSHTANGADLTQAAADDASRGLRIEGTHTLESGSYLFRLVERADTPDAGCISSPWWFQESTIRKILLKARDHCEYAGIALNNAACKQAREAAALSATWAGSGANYLLVGKIIAPVAFIWGAPKPVGLERENAPAATGLNTGATIESIECVPNPLCVQFYLPGMRDTRMASKCISPQGRFKFSHSPELAEGDIEGFLRKVKGAG
ncbi:hypothetical protein [Paraburkholderia sp. J63]|uniref:hypothetical protein n=1 Tax=Paraburkholderia sp. J63 TaxID=2805434 RepID=UPI002ABD1447|nr:hypothetical protein [Paraburkholderia sp. J63]